MVHVGSRDSCFPSIVGCPWTHMLWHHWRVHFARLVLVSAASTRLCDGAPVGPETLPFRAPETVYLRAPETVPLRGTNNGALLRRQNRYPSGASFKWFYSRPARILNSKIRFPFGALRRSPSGDLRRCPSGAPTTAPLLGHQQRCFPRHHRL